MSFFAAFFSLIHESLILNSRLVIFVFNANFRLVVTYNLFAAVTYV